RRALAAHRPRAGLRRDRRGDGLAVAESKERDSPRPAEASNNLGAARGGPLRRPVVSCRQVDTDALESLCAGELPADSAERLRAHCGSCAACANELAWLTAERELLAQRARRSESPAAHLWAGVQSARPAP